MAPFLRKIPLDERIATGISERFTVHCREQYFRSKMYGKPIILQVQTKATAMMVSSSQKSSDEPPGNKTLPPLPKSSNKDMEPLFPLPFAVKDDWEDIISNLSDDMNEDTTFLGDTEDNLATLVEETRSNGTQRGLLYGADNSATVEGQLCAHHLQHQQPPPESNHFLYEPTNVDNLAELNELNEFSQLLLDDIITTTPPETEITVDMSSQPPREPFDDPEVQPLPPVSLIPGPQDVVMGRGGKSNNHPGNKKFHRKKKDLQPKYLSCSRNQKRKVAKELIDWVFQNGGRFLRKTESNGEWEEAPFDKVILKSSQALRTVKD